MKKSTQRKKFLHYGLGAVISVMMAGSALAGDSNNGNHGNNGNNGGGRFAQADATSLRSLAVVDPARVVPTFKMAPIDGDAKPFVIGTYWNCSGEGVQEICRLKLVVCDSEDPGFCVEV